MTNFETETMVVSIDKSGQNDHSIDHGHKDAQSGATNDAGNGHNATECIDTSSFSPNPTSDDRPSIRMHQKTMDEIEMNEISDIDDANRHKRNKLEVATTATIDTHATAPKPVGAIKGSESTGFRLACNGSNDSSKSPPTILQEAPKAPKKGSIASEAPGKFRHVVAVLALSSIVLANTNRQAYNQALSRMVKPRQDPVIDANSTSTQISIAPMSSTLPPLPFDNDYDDQTTSPNNYTTANFEDSDNDGQLNKVKDNANHNWNLLANDDEYYDWSGKQVSVLQGAFSYGYMPFMIPGGRLSEIYGAKWVVFLSGFGSALCTLSTPFLARYSFTLLVASRVIMGICQTGVSPALYALLTRWLVPDESSVYLAMIKVGVMIGFMFGSLINGFLSWKMTFYFVGLTGLLWSVMWAFCVTSNPEDHKYISERELTHIQTSLGRKVPVKTADDSTNKVKKNKRGAPWLKIITNPVVLAFMFTKFTVKLSTDTQSMQLPMYLKNVLHVSDRLNGPLNAANFAIQAVFTGFVAFTAKEMIRRKSFGFSKTGIRRLFQGINNFGMAFGYFLVSMNMGSLVLASCAVLFIAVTSMFGSGGESILPVDLTTEYSASIMAIANSVANLSGIVLPPLVSLLLNNQLDDPTRWNYVWYCISGVVATGGLVFCLFVRAKLQNFEDQDGDKDKDKDNGKDNDTNRNEVYTKKVGDTTMIDMGTYVTKM